TPPRRQERSTFCRIVQIASGSLPASQIAYRSLDFPPWAENPSAHLAFPDPSVACVGVRAFGSGSRSPRRRSRNMCPVLPCFLLMLSQGGEKALGCYLQLF